MNISSGQSPCLLQLNCKKITDDIKLVLWFGIELVSWSRLNSRSRWQVLRVNCLIPIFTLCLCACVVGKCVGHSICYIAVLSPLGHFQYTQISYGLCVIPTIPSWYYRLLVCMFVCVCLFVCLSVSVSVCLHLSVRVYLSVSPSLSVSVSVCVCV